MQARTARIKARLAESDQYVNLKEYIDIINRQINPPEKLNQEQVYVRAMYIVSDEVNSFGGRFPFEEFEHLSQLLIDSPVMIGHRKDKLPIGRNFHSEIEIKNNRYWIKTYFYWLKNSDFSETLKKNIDGGVYKECSIGFTFYKAECSICNKDIRICNHEPFKIYDSKECYFNYRQIEKVLETSIVYRGAVPNTSITNKLKFPNVKTNEKNNSLPDFNKELLVLPNYDGMFLSINRKDNHHIYYEDESKRISYDQIDNLLVDIPRKFKNIKAILVGYRGKERCCYEHLLRYMQKKSSPVTHLEMKLLPIVKNEQLKLYNNSKHNRTHMIKYAFSNLENLTQNIKLLATKNGVIIWDLNSLFIRENFMNNYTSNNSYEISKNKNSENLLKLNLSGYSIYFKILNDKFILEDKKKISVINQIFPVANFHEDVKIILSGKINNYKIDNSSVKMHLKGSLSGEYVIRPLIVKGHTRQVLYKV